MLRHIALSAVAAFAVIGSVAAQQSSLSGFVSRDDLDSMQAAITASQAAQGAKQAAIPTTGPGAGLCRLTVVPSNLVSSGGVAGTAGTCSRIVQCGTSADYVVTQFNVGSGC